MNEVRLIDANALKYKNLAEVNGKLTYVLTAEEINNAPTVEAYPFEQVQELVKLNQQFAQEIENLKRLQGEWYYSCDKGWECNKCHKIVKDMPIDDNKKATYDFCPNCGADMRKPNCVTCDHFGECEGCEKGEEE